MTLKFLTAGESHGPALVVILEGLPAGLPLEPDLINRALARRQGGSGAGLRMQIESDQVRILGGVMGGLTNGAPLALLLENRDHKNWQDKAVPPFTIPRPGHADLAGAVKYAVRDLRPILERASARETSMRTAVGAVCQHLFAQFGIRSGGYVAALGGVVADLEGIPLVERAARAAESPVRCPDPGASAAMQEGIQNATEAGDTIGGIIEVYALDLPPGLGSYVHWERRLDSRIGAALLSIPSVKGIEIGPAFENSGLPGTQVQDAIRLEGTQLVRPTDRCGGLEGGITTGQPLLARAALKPVPTTRTPQPSVDLASGAEVPNRYERSDVCPVPRAVPVVEAMLSFVLADALLEKLGGDSLAELLPRFDQLRRARLEDLQMDGFVHTWWSL